MLAGDTTTIAMDAARELLERARRAMPRDGVTRAVVPPSLDAALEAYLDHLRVERGLSAATSAPTTPICAPSLPMPRHRDVGHQRRAGTPLDRRLGRPPSTLRPSSVRRKSAAIRAFYDSAPARS